MLKIMASAYNMEARFLYTPVRIWRPNFYPSQNIVRPCSSNIPSSNRFADLYDAKEYEVFDDSHTDIPNWTRSAESDQNNFNRYTRDREPQRMYNNLTPSSNQAFNKGLNMVQLPQANFEDPLDIKKNNYVESELLKNIPESEIKEYRAIHDLSTSFNAPRPIMKFEQVIFPEQIMKQINEQNFEAPMPVQAQVWPVAIMGKDLVGIGQTGSGKTLGFIIPALIHILNNSRETYDGPHVVILAPTRELTQQIYSVAKSTCRYMNIEIACVYGGRSKVHDVESIKRRPKIIIGTPGRFNDLMNDMLSLNHCSYFVLDEADRMLDMGFEPQIRRIANQIRTDRQTLMFSATWPKEIRQLAAVFMNKDSVLISVGSTELKANINIKQDFIVCGVQDKYNKILEVLQNEKMGKSLIFIERKVDTKNLNDRLFRQGIACNAIHGNLSQPGRDNVMEKFRKGRIQHLLATDVASRGLDVKDISLVVNYDLPKNIESYIHRIGRTARANNKGRSISFITPDDVNMVQPLINSLRKNNMEIPEELNLQKIMSTSSISQNFGNTSQNQYGNNNYNRRNQYGNTSHRDYGNRFNKFDQSGRNYGNRSNNDGQYQRNYGNRWNNDGQSYRDYGNWNNDGRSRWDNVGRSQSNFGRSSKNYENQYDLETETS